MKNYFDVKGKVAIVTGASSGLGRQFAVCLAEQGANIAIVARRVEKLEEVKTEVEGYGVKCLVLPCDVTDTQQIKTAVETTVQTFGRIDILINNAGISHIGLLSDMSNEEWDHVLRTNLSSVFYCSRAAIPYMVSKKCGKILNISSMWGTVGASCEVAYSATKSGIHGLTRALAKELAPSNIQVNAIACGVIDTEMNGRLNEEERQDLMDEIPSGRFADPEEIAELALKLTDTPAYMTGQIIGIDGGFI